MHPHESRRNFLKLSSLSLGTFMLPGSVKTDKHQLMTIPRAGAPLKIVCVGAHPGDPEFGCGGTMARYSEAGHLVTFLYLTRGEAYDAKKTYAESAALRTAEAEKACKGLKVTPKFAGQIDGNTVLNNETNAEMMKMLQAEKPDIVYTQWPVDSHMDHQVAGQLALSSWSKMNRSFDLYFYEVNTGAETMSFTPTDYVDISDVTDRKKAAMNAHQSQDPVGTYDSFFREIEAFRGLEAGVKAAEAFILFRKQPKRAALPE